MHDFTPVSALAGGALIGLSASLLLLSHGRIAGMSEIVGDLFFGRSAARPYRLWFAVGLLAAGLAMRLLTPASFGSGAMPGFAVAALSGLVVGFGSRMGGGCTSGHGVCGIGRLSARSIVATMTFMATGAVTVYVARHLAGLR